MSDLDLTVLDDDDDEIDSPTVTANGATIGTAGDGGDLDADDVGAIPEDEKGAESGVASLTSEGVLRGSQVPTIAITDVEVIDSESELTEQTEAELGDVRIAEEEQSNWILANGDPTVEDNWTEFETESPPVQSVFGRDGDVDALEGDYDDHYVTNGDYEVQKDGTDGDGVINFKT